MSNKKVLVISVISVIVLVAAIIATSYATFTASLTGTKENKITTGYVTMNCEETTFNLSDVKPYADDSEGITNGGTATCKLSVNMNGTMKIGYDIGFTDVTPSATLTAENVKFQAYKQIGSSSAEKTYLAGTTATSGVTFQTVSGTNTTGFDTVNVPSYLIDSSEVSATQDIYYTFKTWVTSEADGSKTTSSNTEGVCSDTTYTDQESCEQNNEVWGTSQTVSQAGGSFSFKLAVGSTQTGV